MPRISPIEILKRSEQPFLSLRAQTSVEKLPFLIGSSFAKLQSYLEEINEVLADVPFVAYHNMDMENLDVEMGFPIAKTIPGKEDIFSLKIPEGKVLFCMYQGPYSEIEPTYREMLIWAEERNLKPINPFYEYYYNRPETPTDKVLTKIIVPVEDII